MNVPVIVRLAKMASVPIVLVIIVHVQIVIVNLLPVLVFRESLKLALNI